MLQAVKVQIYHRRGGGLYLFPRLVARGNYSRIGIARVRFDEAGDPAGVERRRELKSIRKLPAK
jgi:hypothetical protein